MILEDIRGSKQYDNIYLIGNGDSLDVRTLKNPAFACNLINRIYPETEWRPWYYVCLDTLVLDKYENEVRENIAAARIAFVPVEVMPIFSMPNVIPIIVKHEPFDDVITEGIYSYATTLHAALQIAHYMGHSEVTFKGCDFYSGKQLHFYRDDIMNKLSPMELSKRKVKNILAHAMMIKWAEERGMKVFY